MDPNAIQPYIERAIKAEETIVQLKKQIADLEAIVYSKDKNVNDNDNVNIGEQNKQLEEKGHDKSKTIEEFLLHRPKPNEVGINLNISSTLYETIRHLEYEQKKDSVHQKIERRPSQEDLKSAGILEFTELAPSLHASAHLLEKEIAKDKLQKKS